MNEITHCRKPGCTSAIIRVERCEEFHTVRYRWACVSGHSGYVAADLPEARALPHPRPRGDQGDGAVIERIPKRIRVRTIPRVRRAIVSMDNGYLWIGGDAGPCMVAIGGRKTLLKIAKMVQRYAR